MLKNVVAKKIFMSVFVLFAVLTFPVTAVASENLLEMASNAVFPQTGMSVSLVTGVASIGLIAMTIGLEIVKRIRS